MPDQTSLGSMGNAQIKRQGHTTDGKFGTNPSTKVKGSDTPRDLKLNIK